MNIVIIGAGETGRYIASILSKEEHNIVLVDPDPKKLEAASATSDIATRLGVGSNWQLLDDLMELSPDLLIVLTNDDESNLVTCSLAKHLGYPRTICRISNLSYLNRTRLDFGNIFDIDSFIGPEILVANDILKYMISPGSLAVENFAFGAVQLRTIEIPKSWRKVDKPLGQLNLPKGVMVGLIRREIKDPRSPLVGEKTIIFPHGNDHILPGDEATFIGETDVIANIHQFFGIPQKTINSVVIVGGSLTAINLAKLLEHRETDVRIIEKDFEKCCKLADQLPYCTIMHHDPSDLEFIKAEKIGLADVFIACTDDDEVNFVTGLLGKESGCDEVIVMIGNSSYSSLISQLGMIHTVSPQISAANHILSQILSGKVTSLISLYDNQAEIMEINVSNDSKLVGIPLLELGPYLPKDFLIAVIQNRGRIMIAHGTRIISPGDTVIVITSPKHVVELEKIF